MSTRDNDAVVEVRFDVEDLNRKYVSPEGSLLFGKYRGEDIEDVRADRPDYLTWMLDTLDLSEAERTLVKGDTYAIRSVWAPNEQAAINALAQQRRDKARWYTTDPGGFWTVDGPFTFAEVEQAIRAGEFTPDTMLVREDGYQMGRPLREITEFRTVLIDRPLAPAAARSPYGIEIDLGGGAEDKNATRASLLSVFAARQAALDAAAKDYDLPPLDLAPLELPNLDDAPTDYDLPLLDDRIQATAKATELVWTDEQREALTQLARWAKGDGPRMISLTGYAGVGKSTLLREAVKTMRGAHLCAMTGKAALRLREVTGYASTTLHYILYKPPEESKGGDIEFSSRREPTMATLVVDEASMITPRIYMDLEAWAARGVRILLVGDPFQLPPILNKADVEAWGEDFTVFEKVKGPTLTRVMRSSGAVLDAATYLRTNRRVLRESSGPYTFKALRDTAGAAVRDYLADPIDHVLVTWRNELRMSTNRAIRARLGKQSPLPERGEPVLIKQNTEGYMNGEIVTVDGWRDGPTIGGGGEKAGLETKWLRTSDGFEILTLTQGYGSFFDGGRPFIEDWYAWRRFCNNPEERPTRDDGTDSPIPIPIPVTYGYCLTCHAVQGSEFRRVTTFLGPGDGGSKNFNKPSVLPSGETVSFSIRFLYTSLTRAKVQATLYVSGG